MPKSLLFGPARAESTPRVDAPSVKPTVRKVRRKAVAEPVTVDALMVKLDTLPTAEAVKLVAGLVYRLIMRS